VVFFKTRSTAADMVGINLVAMAIETYV